MTSSDQVNDLGFYAEPLPFKMAKILLYAAILVFGTVGNIMVILIVLRFKDIKKSPGHFFILNLAVCDLLIPLISIPFDVLLVETNYQWHLGPTMCKVIPAMTTFVATSSPLTLAAIALDRYRTLLHPFKRRLDVKTVKLLIALVHLSSAVLVLPHLVTLDLSPNGSYCVEVWSHELHSKIYTFVLFLGQYALPLLFMSIIYILTAKNLHSSTQKFRSMSLSSASTKSSTGKSSRSLISFKNNSLTQTGVQRLRVDISHESLERYFRKESESNAQVTKMFIVIVAVFAVLTLPLEVLWLWRDFAGGSQSPYQPIISVVCRLFTYANSCFNPIIFYKLSPAFHKGFLAVFNGSFSCFEREDTFKQSRITNRFGSWDGMCLKVRTPSCMTLKGSSQSSQSTDLVDQVKVFPNTPKMGKTLSVPSFDQISVQKKSTEVEMFPSITVKRQEEIFPNKDKANSLHGSGTKAEPTRTTNLLDKKSKILSANCEDGGGAVELCNLDMLEVLQQTDC